MAKEKFVGKVFKVFDNEWGLTIAFNVRDDLEETWKSYHLIVFKKTQSGLYKAMKDLKEQTTIQVACSKYEYPEKHKNKKNYTDVEGHFIVSQFKVM